MQWQRVRRGVGLLIT